MSKQLNRTGSRHLPTGTLARRLVVIGAVALATAALSPNPSAVAYPPVSHAANTAGHPTCDGKIATIRADARHHRIIGTPGNDVIVGTSGDDVIRGLAGDDIICGGAGNDRLYGGAGNDRLYGGAGNDILIGGKGHNILIGGKGHDALEGGPGDTSQSFPYTGTTQELVIPNGVTSAHLVVIGATGSNSNINRSLWGAWGDGAKISGDLPLKSGDVLTIAAGGRGGPNDGNHSPGSGGWAISGQFQGGRGGSGHGSQTADGSGGGGASVVQLNGVVAVVAGGGGGEGGEATHGGQYTGGGSGGKDHGQDGGCSAIHDVCGAGGSLGNLTQDPSGGSYSGWQLKGGGGGGGGGYGSGAGGDASGWGGGGGGGGASLTGRLQALAVDTSNQGNGSVTVSWTAEPTANQVYAFMKTDAPGTQLLDLPGGNPDNGTAVDTWHRSMNGDQIQANQLWTYRDDQATGYGELINGETGKCLEVNGSNGAVDQWDCIPGSSNQLWKLLSRDDGSIALQTHQDGHGTWKAGTYYAATATASSSVINGASLTLQEEQGDTTTWDALKQTP